MMTEAELRDFILGRVVHAFDPESGEKVATVGYRNDGTCWMQLAGSDEVEPGSYGIEGHEYWTRYARFRGGDRHGFYLTALAPDRAQAYHSDGRRAYLLVHRPEAG